MSNINSEVFKLLKNILKKNKFIFYICKTIKNYFLSKWTRYSQKRTIQNKLYFRKKIDEKFLYYGFQLNPKRKIEMESLLKNQINSFKNNKTKGNFMFLEIGSFLGESIELFGNILNNSEIDFTIISIDPYTKYNSEKDEQVAEMYSEINESIENNYLYFLNNISLTPWRENFIHIRQPSENGLNMLKNLNLEFDFIYIDGNHQYKYIKSDYELSKLIIKNSSKYKGIICGDDFELSISQHSEIGLSKVEMTELLQKSKDVDFIGFREFKKGFHPGVTLHFSEINDDIIKTESGFWYLNNLRGT